MAIHTHPMFVALSVLGCLSAPVALASLATPALAASALTGADTDKDGTLDLAEVQAAAGAAFDNLDKDKDSTLDYKEAAANVSKKEFKTADTDSDKTLTKDEYVGMAATLFKDADVDKDGTLTPKELRSKAGRALERLLK